MSEQVIKDTIRQTKVNNASGFSLIEILVALTLLGIAGTFVAGKIFEQLEEGQKKSAKIQMQSLDGRLGDFRRHCGFYPTTDQGLDALINKPGGGRDCKNYAEGGYIKDGILPQDPWDEDYYYDSNGKVYNIHSSGPDQEEGTEDDIYLREPKES
jgi:general secretion pathway protein G